jgi:alpha-N-arabinofuranosidase
MCAQGGTSTAHTEVIFKSDKLMGPYVPWEKNPILTAMDLPVHRPDPVTCTGHADLVQTQNGEWWAVFLACQPYEGNFFNTGRETFMLPVKWEDGWPVILPPRTPVPLTVKKPNLPAGETIAVPTTGNINFTEDFESETLPFRFVGLRAPDTKWYATSKAAKSLFLEPRADKLSGTGNPSYLGVRQQNNEFTASVTLKAQPKTTNCIAGLAAYQNETHYYAINAKIKSGRITELSIEQPAGGGRRGGGSAQTRVLATQKLPENVESVNLQIEMAGPVMKCFYKVGNGALKQLGENLQSSFLSTDTAGGFQGVTLGMFARTGAQ